MVMLFKLAAGILGRVPERHRVMDRLVRYPATPDRLRAYLQQRG